MKIGEFASQNQVTTKMLRYYDEMGLLRPTRTDPDTGYRLYDAGQSAVLNWIIILKNLGFTLAQVGEMLSGPVDCQDMIHSLIRKRIEIMSRQNEDIQKKLQVDRLIRILEKEGFMVDQKIDLLKIDDESIQEIKKNMPNMEEFLEKTHSLASLRDPQEKITILRFDISHFKHINDLYGYEQGDKVIVACYQAILSSLNGLAQETAIGRAGGDEFIIFLPFGEKASQKVAESILESLKSPSFKEAAGVREQITGRIGGVCSSCKSRNDLRSMIDYSIELLQKAGQKGPGSIAISCGGD